jgi:hypothetical protein
MAAQETRPRLQVAHERAAMREDALTVGIAAFAFYELALAVLMVAFPHFFYANVGPFGSRNDHYTRDVATFGAALGVGLAVSIRSRSWRVPMLAITTIQFALHSVNHLVDIERAHPSWTGYFDFFALAAATILVGALLRLALLPPAPSARSRDREADR